MQTKIMAKRLSDFKYLLYYNGSMIGFNDYKDAIKYCKLNNLNKTTLIPVKGEIS